MSLKVLVCGSRDWTDIDAVTSVLARWYWDRPVPTVLHGDAPGADRFAATVAAHYGYSVKAFPADWEPGPLTRYVRKRRDGSEYDPEAGKRRNLQMLDERPDLVIAFQRNGSRGTQHTIDEARKRGIPVEVYER